MKIKKIGWGLVGAVAMVMGVLRGTAVYAEEEKTPPVMTISPMYQQIILTPGEEFKGSIMISNAASAIGDLKYALSIGSFSQHPDEGSEDDYGVVDVDQITAYNQIMDWITLDRKDGSVKPNETQTINFTIKVPESAPAGGQYATILIENVPNKDIEELGGDGGGAGVMIESKTQMASILYADVAGETRKKGEVIENKVPTFLFEDKLEATSMIENMGNVHTEAEVLLQVWPMFGGDNVCSIKEEGEEETVKTLVLPDTKRFHRETCKLPSVGIYKIKQTVKVFGEESVVEGTLIYCPIWIILMIIFGIVLAIIWLVMMTMGRKKKMRMVEQ